MKKISQAEARRLRKRVNQLEAILRKQALPWSAEWPDGIHILIMDVDDQQFATIKTARKLNYAVLVNVDSGNVLTFHAQRLPERCGQSL